MNFSSRSFYNIRCSDDQKLDEANDEPIITVIGNSSDLEMDSTLEKNLEVIQFFNYFN